MNSNFYRAFSSAMWGKGFASSAKCKVQSTKYRAFASRLIVKSVNVKVHELISHQAPLVAFVASSLQWVVQCNSLL